MCTGAVFKMFSVERGLFVTYGLDFVVRRFFLVRFRCPIAVAAVCT